MRYDGQVIIKTIMSPISITSLYIITAPARPRDKTTIP